jgi:hypothetical protein
MRSDASEDEDAAREREVAALKREAVGKCRFARETFSPSPMLVATEPNDSGVVAWFRFTGQDYDPSRWRLVPGGWDHEHCFLCWKHIRDGDTYWSNTGRSEIDLCEECYAQYRVEHPA